jgi:NADH-quinone oxidoreductase subunit L
MFELRWLLILIPALPLLSALLTAVLGPRVLREKSHVLTVAALAGSFLCSLGVVRHVVQYSQGATTVGYEHTETLWTWATIPDALPRTLGGTAEAGAEVAKAIPFELDVTLRADGLTALMLPMVTFIATLVAIYASGYMHGDRSYWRFFACVSLFVFSMTMLVLVSNFLLLFVFWEAVGLCSYLLIGFWYEKPEAAAAGKKAFLVNRVGDFGFALALFLLWVYYGTWNFHDTETIAGIFGQQRLSGAIPYVGGGVATAICVLLMTGACGKSAQFPLHVWLPDAMEGPTPVSALIHAATMVTAGVYMVARCTPLFHESPDAQLVVAVLGGITALMAGLIALTQFDLKRVLAYSTVSQLGYMFLALGTGTLAGISAGMFHLFTHAFFKALLFLGAGSVMHAMGHVIDMRRFSGLRHLMPWTHRTFLVGCLALAGVFPFAGFWSKDQIVAALHGEMHPAAAHAGFQGAGEEAGHAGFQGAGQEAGYAAVRVGDSKAAALADSTLVVTLPVADAVESAHATTRGATKPSYVAPATRMRIFGWLYVLSLVTAFLTAFYTFRAYYMTFFGPEVVPPEAGHHAHESPPIMWGPLAVLAIFAFGVGFVFESGHSLAWFLSTAPSIAYLVPSGGFQGGEFHFDIALISTVVALLGIGLASYCYLGHHAEVDSLGRKLGPLRTLSYRKFFIDEIYNACIVAPLRGLGALSYLVDRWVVDGLVNLCGRIPVWCGALFRRWQSGLVPFYSLMMALGTLVIVGLGGWLWFGG